MAELVIGFGKPKGMKDPPKSDKDMSMGDEDEGAEHSCDSLLGEAFDAFADKDREGFVAAMRAAFASYEADEGGE